MMRAFMRPLAWCALVIVAGCGNPQAEKLGSGGASVSAEAHDEIFSTEVFGGIEYSAELGDLDSAREIATSPDFKAKVDQFEQAGLPSEWSGREAAKDELVKALRDLIATAESGGDLKAAIDNVNAANRKLTGPQA